MVPMKEKYGNKLIFLHGLKPWVWNFLYQRIDILDTYQGLMKMVECMENTSLLHLRVKLEGRSPKSIMPAKAVEAKAKTNASGAEVKLGSHDDKKKMFDKQSMAKKEKWDLSRTSVSTMINTCIW
jgi:hypothetical protein